MAEANASSCDRLSKEPTTKSGEGIAKAGWIVMMITAMIANIRWMLLHIFKLAPDLMTRAHKERSRYSQIT